MKLSRKMALTGEKANSIDSIIAKNAIAPRPITAV